MTIARKQIVDNQTAGFYHCTNRCVRRTFLCGIDKLTGKDFSHRKDWLENRMFELCKIFSVDIYAYAVMGRFLLLQNPHISHPCEKQSLSYCSLLRPN